jgi:hypothetical protein
MPEMWKFFQIEEYFEATSSGSLEKQEISL